MSEPNSEIKERLERLMKKAQVAANHSSNSWAQFEYRDVYLAAQIALASVAQQPQRPPCPICGSGMVKMRIATEVPALLVWHCTSCRGEERPASAPVQEEKPDADYIADSHYVAGAMFGWNMGVSNLEDKFWRTLENRNRAMQEYRRARHSSGISEVTDMSRRDQTEKWDEKRSEVSQPTQGVTEQTSGFQLPECAWKAAQQLQEFLSSRGGIDDNAVIAQAFHDYARKNGLTYPQSHPPFSEQKVAEPITAEQFYATGYGDKVCYNGPQWYEFAEEFAKFKGAKQTASLRSQLAEANVEADAERDRAEAAESALRQKELAIAAASNPEIRAMVEDGIESAKAQSGIEVSALRSRESVAIDYEKEANEWSWKYIEHCKAHGNLRFTSPDDDGSEHNIAEVTKSGMLAYIRKGVAKLLCEFARSHDQKRGRSLTIERHEILEYLWREQGCPGTVQEFPTLAAQFTGSSLALVIERWEKWGNEQGWSLDKGLVRSVMHLCSLLQMTHNYQYQWLWDADNRQTVTAETAIAEANKLVASYRQATQPQTPHSLNSGGTEQQ